MVERLRQILADAIANGATDEQQQRIRDAIASAERADAERERRNTASTQNLKQMLRDQAAMGETFAEGYVEQRRRMMAVEAEHLQNLEELAARGVAGAEEMAAAQRATMMQLEQGNVAADSLADSFDNMMNKMGMNKDLSDSVVGRFLIAGPEGFAAIGARIADTLDVQKLFSSGLVQMEQATKDLFNRFDSAQATLAQQTATTGEYNDMLYDTIESNKSYNVSVDDAANAIKDLHNEMTIFNQMSGEQQAMLVETTARMEQLGVSTQAGARQFDNMIQGMGMTANMANDASMELVALGDSIGMAASQISDGFNAAAAELAKYGPQAIDVFKGMAAAAKATGVEMGVLMGITKQFDTFEGAAQSAGKLNAILGGGVVNSMDLLNATEEERVRLLIQSMALSGKNFESLNRFEKQAIASAAGIKDMTEANKIFSMSLSAYDDMQSKARGADAEAAKLQERAQAATSFADKLKQIGQAFAVAFLPVLEFAHGFANIILEINDMTGGIFIPLMLTVVGVLAMLSRVQQLAAIATSVQTGAQFIQTASTQGLAAAQAQLAATQTTTTVTTTAQVPATAALAAAMSSLLAPVIPLTPAIAAVGAAIASIGLAIAAPFIALTALVIAFKEVFIAMLEAPKAIGQATVGLLAFAAAGAASMQIMAAGLVLMALILVPFAGIMMTVAQPLMYFAAAVAVAAGAFYMLAVGLERLGEALMVWKKIKVKTMSTVVESLAMFTAAMIPLILPLTVIGLLVGIPLMMIGYGLNTFADGLAKWRRLGPKYMMNVIESLGMFTGALIPLVLQLTVIGLLVGIPLMMIGKGLQSFAKGLKLFRKIGGDEMENVTDSLFWFTFWMIPLIVPLTIIGLLVGLPLMLIGNGLISFAKGLKKFRRIGSEVMENVTDSLYWFTFWMIGLAIPFAVIGLLVGIPLMLIGHGLIAFAKGLRRFSSIGEEIMENVTDSLYWFTFWMMFLAVPLAFIGLLVSVPLMMLGYSLTVFGKALQEFVKVGVREALLVVASLKALMWLFDDGRAERFAVGAAILSIPLAMISASLIIYGKALQEFSNINVLNATAAIALLPMLAYAVALSADLMLAYGVQFSIGMGLVSLGLYAFGTALQAFNEVGVDTIFIAISALMAFAGAMLFLFATGLMYVMIEGFTLLSVPLGLFSAGLMGIGLGLAMIREEMSAMYALNRALTVIAEIGAYGAYVMDAIAISILRIADAMMQIPENKTIAFGFAMQGYSSALAQVAALTPESVESAEKVVAAAGEYADIQARMKIPMEDAFIQAMKNIFGIGEGQDRKQGQDIVLELNGRELGRAVDAIINKRHNLSVD